MAVQLAHVYDRELEWNWGLVKGSLNLDTRRNIFFVSKSLYEMYKKYQWSLVPEKGVVRQYFHNFDSRPRNRYDFPDLQLQTFKYRFLPVDDMEDVYINRQSDDNTGTVTVHEYPFAGFPVLTSHIHPTFVMLHLSMALMCAKKDRYKVIVKQYPWLARMRQLHTRWFAAAPREADQEPTYMPPHHTYSPSLSATTDDDELRTPPRRIPTLVPQLSNEEIIAQMDAERLNLSSTCADPRVEVSNYQKPDKKRELCEPNQDQRPNKRRRLLTSTDLKQHDENYSTQDTFQLSILSSTLLTSDKSSAHIPILAETMSRFPVSYDRTQMPDDIRVEDTTTATTAYNRPYDPRNPPPYPPVVNCPKATCKYNNCNHMFGVDLSVGELPSNLAAITGSAIKRAQDADPNLQRCLIENCSTSMAVQLAHVYDREEGASDCEMRALEWSWGLVKGSLNLDTRRNIFFVGESMYEMYKRYQWSLVPEEKVVRRFLYKFNSGPRDRYDFPNLQSRTFKYRFLPVDNMEDMYINRQSDDNTVTVHEYPFAGLPVLTSHIHPTFVMLHLSVALRMQKLHISWFSAPPSEAEQEPTYMPPHHSYSTSIRSNFNHESLRTPPSRIPTLIPQLSAEEVIAQMDAERLNLSRFSTRADPRVQVSSYKKSGKKRELLEPNQVGRANNLKRRRPLTSTDLKRHDENHEAELIEGRIVRLSKWANDCQSTSLVSSSVEAQPSLRRSTRVKKTTKRLY
ncbi:hypothetical protein CVT24_005215 [Panaeolus cyanescens]|uniref:HNH nuclease domain-containing protein n=1 Tax=Panaeolus cyanescens TaxID=181874 RepID=A0A409Y9K1_9AGAR|nr:hypothetical protein CVT24_005215 [Panaeolus cyanescens]